MIRSSVLAMLAALSLGATGASAQTPTAPRGSAPSTASMQEDRASWIADPHMHAFYDLTVKAFANGPATVDEPTFQEESFALFRRFAQARHYDPAELLDHLKLIPHQVVQIAREDPNVLTSYAKFVEAVFGPE